MIACDGCGSMVLVSEVRSDSGEVVKLCVICLRMVDQGRGISLKSLSTTERKPSARMFVYGGVWSHGLGGAWTPRGSRGEKW